ncbi:MAG TPA: EamA family transporter, partial [Promineifilum sp.]|nr:EamA family transporter [Promineifilum sp.]
MKPIHYGALLILGAVWGASFLFIGVAVPEFGPLRLMFIRVLLAGLILLGVARLTLRQTSLRDTLRLRENWRKYLIVGLLNSALPFTLIAFSELRLSVSLAAILNSRLLDFVFRLHSVPFRGAYYSANKQFISPLPIRIP